MMKKYAVLSVAILSLLACGCGNSKAKQSKYEKTMEEYATNYYQTYILDKVEGLDVPEISVANLENANVNGESNYDMKKLSGCTKDSYVSLILNENKRDIDSYEFHMNCK